MTALLKYAMKELGCCSTRNKLANNYEIHKAPFLIEPYGSSKVLRVLTEPPKALLVSLGQLATLEPLQLSKAQQLHMDKVHISDAAMPQGRCGGHFCPDAEPELFKSLDKYEIKYLESVTEIPKKRGYDIITNKQKIHIRINPEKFCCEDYGILLSGYTPKEDDEIINISYSEENIDEESYILILTIKFKDNNESYFIAYNGNYPHNASVEYINTDGKYIFYQKKL
jgi:hypothetical protein